MQGKTKRTDSIIISEKTERMHFRNNWKYNPSLYHQLNSASSSSTLWCVCIFFTVFTLPSTERRQIVQRTTEWEEKKLSSSNNNGQHTKKNKEMMKAHTRKKMLLCITYNIICSVFRCYLLTRSGSKMFKCVYRACKMIYVTFFWVALILFLLSFSLFRIRF